MSSSVVRTWGTGGAFGREFGITLQQREARHQRGHSSASLIVGDRNIVIDAGARCAELMIDNDAPLPEIVFLTHEHPDHYGGLDQLVHSRSRSLLLKSEPASRLVVIATRACLEGQPRGVTSALDQLDELVSWISIPEMNTWYIVDGASESLTPSAELERPGSEPLVEFKALSVFHTESAPGACMYVFRVTSPGAGAKTVLFSGDFSAMPEAFTADPDFRKPDLAVLETNTLKVPGRGHSTLERNIGIIRTWYNDEDTATVVMTHIGGFEDCSRGGYDHVPDDNDWLRELDEARDRGEIPKNLTVEIACDGGSYPV